MALGVFECNHEYISLYQLPLYKGSWILGDREDRTSESQEEPGVTRPTAGTV